MGSIDIYHSRRTNYAECYYWNRNESDRVGDASNWIVNNAPSGSFYAKEISPQYNQQQQISNAFLYDANTISLQTDDDIEDMKRGCIVKYNNDVWMVESIQKQPHRKESAMCIDIEYRYIISLRK